MAPKNAYKYPQKTNGTFRAYETNPPAFEDIPSNEKLFRGFPKRPIVLLERFNIMPFLNNNDQMENIRTKSLDIENKPREKIHLHKLSQISTVVLIREDLEKLKREFNETGNLYSKISSKSYKTLKRLHSTTMTITKDERQPKTRREKTEEALNNYRKLEIFSRDISENNNKLQKKYGKQTNENSQGTIDLTNEGVSRAVPLSINRCLNVLTERISLKNSSSNLALNDLSNQLHQNPYNQNYFTSSNTDHTNLPKKAIVDPKSKKTIISRHHCEICGKYLSSRYTLGRHMQGVHTARVELRCETCGEKFTRHSSFKSHKCYGIRDGNMAYDNAGLEMIFDNMTKGLDPLNLEDDCMADYDIPPPIVKLTEYDQNFSQLLLSNINNLSCLVPSQNMHYNIVVQEVPIEF